MVKRLVSLGAAVCILFSFLCIPATAVDSLSGTVRAEFYVSDNFTSWSTRTFDLNYPTSSQYTTITNGDWDYGSLHNFLFNLGPLSSNTVISLSYYFTCKYPAEVANSTAGVSGVYLDVNGGSHAFDPSVGTFTPTFDSSYPPAGDGLQIVAQFDVETSSTEPPIPYPITIQRLFFDNKTHYVETGDVEKDVGLKITSLQVIQSSAPTAELNQLKDIATGIAQSNQILSAMYGDILAVCNSIYERTGSILEAQQKTNELFSSIIPILNSLNTNVANIYSTLNTYFNLVIKAIDNQTVTLDQSIKDAEKALETYLKPMIDYFNELEKTTGESASTLPSHKKDLDGFASDSNGIDDNAVTGLASLLPVFSAFSFVFSVLGIFVGLGIFLLIIRKGLS
nr:MAG TPA: hypothetical protein [Inoviridae sp.]